MDVDRNATANIPWKADEDGRKVQEEFQKFLESYGPTNDDDKSFYYIKAAKQLEQPERNTLFVDFHHLETHSTDLAGIIAKEFYRMYPFLCQALKLIAQDKKMKIVHKQLYVSFENLAVRHKVREMTADKVGQLIRISGQVVRTHPVHPELCKGIFTCDECNAVISDVEQHFKYTQPTKCSNSTCNNRTKFTLDVHKSLFVDFQKVRIQETQAELPRGSIPRSVEVVLRGECVERAQPGDRCDFTGCLIVLPDVSQMSIPGARTESGARHRGQDGYDASGLRGLKSLGVRDLNYKLAFLASSISATNPRFAGKDYSHEEIAPDELWKRMNEAEKEEIKRMSQDKTIVKNLIRSLFPSIYGSDEVKKGVLLMLFGGVPKRTKEGTTLRGDINICIVGDPSTAKSQVLKRVEELSPRAVYTSGKASSAAGLTAAVVKDEESFEFVIEAGALMLADNGVCCIDEFDKMDLRDQVAIHEAMEQQTISITKAGVKATLNARTSILAAANPIGGRYDRSKSLRQNIQMSAPIMSRFDLFFVLVDDCNEVTDYAIARKIVDTHRCTMEEEERVYSVDQIQRYIVFSRCFLPKIGDEAGQTLVEEYKRLRLRDSSGASVSSWRITVRQLESLIRLSEALARLYLQEKVLPKHVKEACRLLNNSIVRVEQPDVNLEEEDEMEVEAGEAESRMGGEQLKMTFEEYKRLSNLIVTRIRHLEDAEAGDGSGGGPKHSELVSWYLEQIQDEVDSEEDLAIKKVVFERVVQRLISNDNILIELPTETGDAGEKSDPILVVHPNYVLEDE